MILFLSSEAMYNLRSVNLDPGAAIATPDGAGARATKSKFQPGVYELASAIEGGSVCVSELLDEGASSTTHCSV